MKPAKEERTSGDMESSALSEEDAELTLGTNTTSGTESPSRSGSIDHDSPMMIGKEEAAGDDNTVTPGPKKKRRRLPLASKGSWRPLLGSEISLPPPPDRSQIEQYMNESFKQWLRLEFLMDYDCQGDTLYCMMCATALPTLSINDIKKHILDNHPTSIYFNTAQKGIIVESWINRKAAPEEIVDVEDEMDEDEEEDAEVDLTKKLFR